MAHLASTTPFPNSLKIKTAKGIYLYDDKGTAYMDLISGIGVNAIGHQHPEVISAIKKQTDAHLHVMVFGEYEQSVQEEFAKAIIDFFPTGYEKVYFVNSGAEATEAALKLAKRVTGRSELISLKNAYHGNTHGAMSVSYKEEKKAPFRPLLPGVTFIEQNNLSDLNTITSKTAGVIIETIQGDAGVRIPTQEWLSALQKKCNETGTLIIADEIQCGFGRTGKNMAFEHFNFSPDIVIIGKAMAGGMPMGAVVAKTGLLDYFTHGPMLGHITTFGGHPVNCAAGLANLKVLNQENWIAEAEEKGRLLKSLIADHAAIKEVRQIGLFMAVDLESEAKMEQFLAHLRDTNKALVFRFLSNPYAFRMAPPLCITKEEITEAAKRINDSLNTLI